jgi:hypothetical protein
VPASMHLNISRAGFDPHSRTAAVQLAGDVMAI